jgi:hypothetical protein
MATAPARRQHGRAANARTSQPVGVASLVGVYFGSLRKVITSPTFTPCRRAKPALVSMT